MCGAASGGHGEPIKGASFLQLRQSVGAAKHPFHIPRRFLVASAWSARKRLALTNTVWDGRQQISSAVLSTSPALIVPDTCRAHRRHMTQTKFISNNNLAPFKVTLIT